MPSTTAQRLRDMGAAISTTFPSFVDNLEEAATEMEDLITRNAQLTADLNAATRTADQHS